MMTKRTLRNLAFGTLIALSFSSYIFLQTRTIEPVQSTVRLLTTEQSSEFSHPELLIARELGNIARQLLLSTAP